MKPKRSSPAGKQPHQSKQITDYLELMESAYRNEELEQTRRLGEDALKKLSGLKHSPHQKFLLYFQLGTVYYDSREYSASLDAFYKASVIASGNRLAPEYLASALHRLGLNYLYLYRTDLSLRQFQIVEQYYQKHGYKKPPMLLEQYVLLLIDLGYCYLQQKNLEKAREIIEEKLPAYQSEFTQINLIDTHRLKGEYLCLIKDYTGSRLAYQQAIQAAGAKENFRESLLHSKIMLAYLDILESQPGSAITLLKTVLKEAGQLKDKPSHDTIMCITLLFLNKCYTAIGFADKAAALEKRLQAIIKKLDVVWFYNLNKEIDSFYQQLETSETQPPLLSGQANVPSALTRLRENLNKRLSARSADEKENRYVIITKSPVLIEVSQLIEKVAPTDLPILIYGETGTGKELAARAIHQKSLRHQRTWLACNTGAIPETLLESELFGYVKGAFTGAQTDKKGYIELASDGTLFLDEVGSMSLGMQQKLLRVMEDNLLWRVGAEKPIPVNTRFVFASNENLEELVREKRFREDLLYRINTIVINLPPLRERPEDIPLLVQYFLKKYTGRSDSFQIPDSAFRILTAYPWPGNVRELENEIKRICTLHSGEKVITESIISETIRKQAQPAGKNVPTLKKGLTLKEMTDSFQKNVILEALTEYKGNISEVARQLGYDRSGLYKKMRELDIKPL